jgi:hypothetical protein
VAALLLVSCCLAAVAGGLIYSVWPRPVAKPLVLISSPRHGEEVVVGAATTVEAVARDETRVTRVELWVDGELRASQTSSLPGGTSPFPLLASWQPLSPGTHSLVVRAFNAQNARAYASVNVEALEGMDRDGDGMADEPDDCPDEPGSPMTAGCPDSDGDGVADGEDSCPDQPGLLEYDGCPMTDDRDLDGIADDQDECPDESGTPVTEGCPDADGDSIPDYYDGCPEAPGALGGPGGDGCPAPSATDGDGDGVADDLDVCPNEGGSPLTDGCPDADGDGVSDSDDDCPAEPGLPGADGCPVPRSGEDSDADGVPDVDDACPEEWGLPEYAGCPDSDHDGVPDPDDLSPEDAGLPEMGGADTDGDGVPDDTDECVSEEGLGEHAGCPPPGSETDVVESSGNPFAGLVARVFSVVEDPQEKADVDVEVELLSFETDESYNHVYCYVGLAGGDMDRYTLSRLGETRWDRMFDGENSLTVTADDEHLLELRAECGAYRTYLGAEEGWEGPPFDLGSFIRGHPVSEWDGREFEVASSGGTEGRSFHAKYRLCLYSCETGGLPPPSLSVVDSGLGHQLVWDWGGVPGEIAGFKLYVNGAFNGNTFDRDVRTWALPESWEPSCTERVEFQLTAYSFNPFDPERESPRSNTLVLEGPPCPRTVRVTFDQLETYDLGGEQRMDGNVGPIWGGFAANDETLGFDACDYPDGYALSASSSYSIQRFFDTIWDWKLGCMGDRCPDYDAPDANYVTVEVGGDESLTIGGYINDQDYTSYERLFNGWHSIEPGEIVPGPLEIRDGQVQLTVQIDVLVGPEAGSQPDLIVSDLTADEEGQLRIYVFNNAGDLVNQDVTVEVARLSSGEVIDTVTWPNITIPSGGEVRLQRPDLVLLPHDLRVTVDPHDAIEEMNNRNNVYETPVRMRVEILELSAPDWTWPCEPGWDREAELSFLLWVGHGPSPDETHWIAHRVRYPESGILELDTTVGVTRAAWSLEGQDQYTFGFEMPADDNLYVMMAGYEHDTSRTQSMGRIEMEYGSDVNYGHSDEAHGARSSGPGAYECEQSEPIGPEYFGFGAQWRITRVH